MGFSWQTTTPRLTFTSARHRWCRASTLCVFPLVLLTAARRSTSPARSASTHQGLRQHLRPGLGSRKDKRGVDLISDALPFGRLWYATPDHAIGHAMHYSRSHDAVIRVYDAAGNVIETHPS